MVKHILLMSSEEFRQMDDALEVKRAYANSLADDNKTKSGELLKVENQYKLIKVKVVAMMRILEKTLQTLN